jgi:cyclopropane fatty-acyl-phospholipid synthase-like methyltransferase
MSASGPKAVMLGARARALRARRRLKLQLELRSGARRAALVGSPELWESQRRFQFDFLTSHGLQPEHRLVDIGCGTLRGGIPLIEYLDDGNYTGIEARATVLDEGRKELLDAGLQEKHPVLINASDPANVELGAPVDVAWAFMALIHMPDAIADAYLELLARGLAQDGKFYGNVNLGERPDGSWQGFPVVTRKHEFYEGLAASHGLEVKDVGVLESLGHKLGAPGDKTMMLCFTRAS